MRQEMMGFWDGSGISWTICRQSAPCSRQITTHHTHPFNGPLSGTTWVSRYQKGKTNLDFTGTRDSEWQWNQLDHMQVCTLLQTDNHASTHHSVFYRPDALPAAQPTVSKHWRQFVRLNHTNTPLLNFCRPDALPGVQPTASSTEGT